MLLQSASPQTQQQLRETAESYPEDKVRASALREMVRTGKDDPETVAFLKNRAQSDSSAAVMQVAMKELARVWKDDPATLNWFKTYAQYAQSPTVRSLAVKILAQEWQDEYNVFEIVSKCAFADRFVRQTEAEVNPRQVALEAMLEQYTNYPQTWAFIEDRAENDPDPVVRDFAQVELDRKQRTETSV